MEIVSETLIFLPDKLWSTSVKIGSLNSVMLKTLNVKPQPDFVGVDLIELSAQIKQKMVSMICSSKEYYVSMNLT